MYHIFIYIFIYMRVHPYFSARYAVRPEHRHTLKCRAVCMEKFIVLLNPKNLASHQTRRQRWLLCQSYKFRKELHNFHLLFCNYTTCCRTNECNESVINESASDRLIDRIYYIPRLWLFHRVAHMLQLEMRIYTL